MSFLAAWLLAAGASGQALPATGNVYGTVLDTQGNVVAGASVTLTGPVAAQKADSDARGDFHFLGLSPGDYTLELERQGFEAVGRNVTVELGKNAVLSITLPVAGAAEAITVGGERPSLDNRRIETGVTFGQTELEQIPSVRTPWAILQQVPGVLFPGVNVGGVVEPPRPVFVGKGSHPDQNSYQLDGVPLSLGGIPPFFFDFDSLSNVDVTTGGADPSLATAGVTLSLVTKRGTNEIRASARALYSGGVGWDYGIEAGGPLWKDRLWLWAAFAHNDYLSETVGLRSGEFLRSAVTLAHWNAKLNAEVVPANALTLAYTNFDRSTLGWLVDPDRSDDSNSNNFRPGQSYTVEDSHVFSAKLFAALSLSYVTNASANTPRGGADKQAFVDENGIWRRSYLSRFIGDDKHQAGLNVTAFFDTGRVRHELKFGFGYRHARFDSASSWPGDQIFGNERSQLAVITRPQKVNTQLNASDAFVGDTIRAGDLTVNVGARFDYQQGKNLPSAVPANPVFPAILPAVHYGGDAGYPIAWRKVQPRVGVIYALPDKRTLLRASYSRFANQLDSTTVGAINAFPGAAERGFVWTDVNADGFVGQDEIDLSNELYQLNVDPLTPGSSAPINRIARGLEPPTTDELIVGVERQLSSDLSGSVAYTHRTLRNLLFSPRIGTTSASYEYRGNATGSAVGTDDFVLNFSEPYYGLADCPDPCGTLLRNRPDARETYDGVELQLLKAFSDGWMARVSFAYNDWRQHIGPGAIVNPNNETPGTNATGPVVESGINARWQFNVSGMVQLPLGIAAGVNLFGREGFPILYSVDAITNDLQFNVPSIQIGPAARYRYPAVYQLDFQISRVFRVGSSMTVSPQLDCFNALNSRPVLLRQGAVGSYEQVNGAQVFTPYEDFNTALEKLSSRVVRGGVRISF
jgi:hypothetical protein